MSGPTQPIRMRDDEWQYRCTRCLSWWPLTRDYWQPELGMARCKACILESKRISYARSPEAKREAMRLYRASEPGVVHTIRWERLQQRRREDPAFRARNLALKAANQRAYRARRKDRAA